LETLIAANLLTTGSQQWLSGVSKL